MTFDAMLSVKIKFIVMSVVMQSVLMLSVLILNVVMLSVVILNVVMQSVVMLKVTTILLIFKICNDKLECLWLKNLLGTYL